MISEHASPMATLGSEDAGGQNVYVDEVSRRVAQLGYPVDVFTRREHPDQPPVCEWAPGVRVISLAAGRPEPIRKDQIWPHMAAFRDAAIAFVRADAAASLIHANFWMSGWAGCELKQRWQVPLVQIFHALGVVKRLHQGDADTSPNERPAVEQRILDESDWVIAQCPAEVDDLRTYYRADPARISVIPSGVNTRLFRPIPRGKARRLLGWPPDEPVVLYVGRLLPRKGIDNLIRTLPALAERITAPPRLVVVGGETATANLRDEPEMRRLHAIAVQTGVLDRVHFVGKRPGRELYRYYSAADVFVSTPWYEPYGLTPLEAMACGTPAVVAAVGGMQFTVLDGQTGFHVPPNAPEALAHRVAILLNDPSLRARFAVAARERVERHFSWAEVGRQVAELYGQILREGDGARERRGDGATGRQGKEAA
ncbi:MAG: glycosyltransferase [Chloroflexi bacterium]|nr:glycosyltransferase [Chloroflexota bacterium]